MHTLHTRFSYRHLMFLLATGSLCAQVAPPDAGEILREAQTKVPVPPAAPRKDIIPTPTQPSIPEALNGRFILVKDIALTGNTIFPSDQLKAVVADQMGQSLNLAGMKVVARRITDYYRERGYLFARAVVPVQEFKEGVLQITLIEGRYDEIKVTATPELVEGITPFLKDLKSGDLLETGKLEHTMLIIDDIPGVWVAPSVSPGIKPDTSNLDVAAKMEKVFGGDVGLDTYGSRYTGYYRAHIALYGNGVIQFGDRLSALAMVTDEAMLLGSLDYEFVVGGSGARWQIGYAHTTYELGREYEVLNASGLAKVWSTKFSYPWVRSQPTNITASIGIQHKDLRDDFLASDTFESKTSLTFPLALQFDHRDTFLSGAVTYGSVSVTLGHLNLDDSLLATDVLTAKRDGSFEKLNLELARIQTFNHDLSVFVRVAAQWASENLDTSESLGIAGIEGVRAYPIGEGSGDTGWLAQVELRHAINEFAPYIFYDAGSNKINYRPWDSESDQRRTLSGAGVGVRYENGRWSGNFSVAYRLDGGAPLQDAAAENYRLALMIDCTF